MDSYSKQSRSYSRTFKETFTHVHLTLHHILAVRLKQAMTGGLIRSLTQYWQVKTVTMYKEPQLKYSTCSCT